jgi:cell division protein FtsB
VTEVQPKTPPMLRACIFLGGLLVTAFIGAALLGSGGVARHEQLRADLEDLEKKNATLRVDNERLSREVEALRGNQRYIERVARDELGWVAPDELVLIFSDETPTP